MDNLTVETWNRRCVLCGEPCDDGMTSGDDAWTDPGWCELHGDEVYRVLDKDYDMWPDDWFGCSSKAPDGFWHDTNPDQRDHWFGDKPYPLEDTTALYPQNEGDDPWTLIDEHDNS